MRERGNEVKQLGGHFDNVLPLIQESAVTVQPLWGLMNDYFCVDRKVQGQELPDLWQMRFEILLGIPKKVSENNSEHSNAEGF